MPLGSVGVVCGCLCLFASLAAPSVLPRQINLYMSVFDAERKLVGFAATTDLFPLKSTTAPLPKPQAFYRTTLGYISGGVVLVALAALCGAGLGSCARRKRLAEEHDALSRRRSLSSASDDALYRQL